MPLLDTLCGKGRKALAQNVFQFLKDKDLTKDLFIWIHDKINKVKARLELGPEEMNTLLSALIIIAKIVKQRPKQFETLNDAYKVMRSNNNVLSGLTRNSMGNQLRPQQRDSLPSNFSYGA